MVLYSEGSIGCRAYGIYLPTPLDTSAANMCIYHIMSQNEAKWDVLIDHDRSILPFAWRTARLHKLLQAAQLLSERRFMSAYI